MGQHFKQRKNKGGGGEWRGKRIKKKKKQKLIGKIKKEKNLYNVFAFMESL